MIQKLEELKKQTRFHFETTPECENCKKHQKLLNMYDKLVKLLKAKLNKYLADESKDDSNSNDSSYVKRALSQNKGYTNKTSSFLQKSIHAYEKHGGSELAPFLKSISTNVSENQKVISKSGTFMKQMKDLSNRIHKKDIRINTLISDLATLKSNMLSIRNIVFQFFRMTPLPRLSKASTEIVKVISNMFQYSQEEKQIMFNNKNLIFQLKAKEDYQIDANKTVYLPNFGRPEPLDK